MDKSETKQKIMSKVFGLLLRKGYDGVSISDIQQETGMARGLLYHYFGSKDQLFIEVTTRYLLELFRIDPEKIKTYGVGEMIAYTLDMYRSIMTQTMEHATPQKTVNMADYDFLFYRVIRESDVFEQKYKRLREHETAAWRVALRNSMQQNRLRSDIDIDKCAVYFSYLMDGVWMNAVNLNSVEALVVDLESTLTDYYKLIKK